MKEANKVDLGSIKIHKKVLSEIVSTAISEIDGVSLKTKDLSDIIGNYIGVQGFPGITVNVDKNNQVIIDVKIYVRAGLNILDIARQVQDVVRASIEKTVDIDLKDVNVNIQGVVKKT